MNRNRQLLLIQIGAAALFLAVLGLGSVLVLRAQYPYQETPRDEMRVLYRHIQIGDTPEQVLSAFDAHNFETLTLVTDAYDEMIWEVHTPFEFNANNWLMWIVFRDDEVHGVIVGTADYLWRSPKGAPPNKMSDGLRGWVQEQGERIGSR